MKVKKLRRMRDFGLEAQRAAEVHLGGCVEALLNDDDTESPASAPFCGCDTCVVREVLWAAWVVIDAYIDDAFTP